MITKEQCIEILSNYKEEAQFQNFTIGRFSDNVLGYLGDHYTLKIFYNEADISKTISFFLKVFPRSSNEYSEYVNQLGVFEKEALLYENLLCHLQKTYREPFLPKMYLTDCKEFIVLENLDRKGYANSKKPLSLQQSQAVLQSLARLHASSIVYEEKQCEKTKNYRISDELITEFKEVSFSTNEDHPRNKWCNNVLKAVLDCIKTIPEYHRHEKLPANLTHFVENSIPNLIKPSQTFRNCVTHCDLWSNNIMFRETENNLECVLVDFQFARYIPPAYDVLLTLYLNLTYSQLEKHLDELLLYYYDNFKERLLEQNVHAKSILSLSEFWNCISFYRKLAVVEATWFGTITFVGDELAEEITTNRETFIEFIYTNRSKYLLREFNANKEYAMKIEGLLKQLAILFK